MTYRLINGFIIFLGFLCIIFSLRDNIIFSGWLILGGLFLDIISKRLERRRERFEDNFNISANLISFGLGPIILAYKNFENFHYFWIFTLFLYLICSAVRLSRFDKGEISVYFKGLPIGISAGLIAMTVILIKRYSFFLKSETLGILIIILSLLMVSRINYPNFQNLGNKKAFLFLVIGLILLNILGESVIWFIFLVYILAGPFLRRSKVTA